MLKAELEKELRKRKEQVCDLLAESIKLEGEISQLKKANVDLIFERNKYRKKSENALIAAKAYLSVLRPRTPINPNHMPKNEHLNRELSETEKMLAHISDILGGAR